MTNEVRQHIRQQRNIVVKRIWLKDVRREAGYKRSEILAQRRAVQEAGIRDTITDKTQTQELRSKDGSLDLDHRNGFGRVDISKYPCFLNRKVKMPLTENEEAIMIKLKYLTEVSVFQLGQMIRRNNEGIRATLRNLEKKGFTERLEVGKWKLTAAGRSELDKQRQM